MTSITPLNFHSAIAVLNQWPEHQVMPQVEFEGNYREYEPLRAAIEIIHSVPVIGSDVQQEELSKLRDRVIRLNVLLPPNSRVALPETDGEKVGRVLSAPIRSGLSVLFDVLLLPVGGALSLYSWIARPNFNPPAEQAIRDRPPVLLLHGSGFNQTEYVGLRSFLEKERLCGSIYSVDYAGLVTNEMEDGWEEYVERKIVPQVQKIQEETGRKDLIIVGHSMGGLVGATFAELGAAERIQSNVLRVITIQTPWHGVPLLKFWRKKTKYKGSEQMRLQSPLRERLVVLAQTSDRVFKRYCSIGSSCDPAVPMTHAFINHDPSRSFRLNFGGHYGPIANLSVWKKIQEWILEAGAQPNM